MDRNKSRTHYLLMESRSHRRRNGTRRRLLVREEQIVELISLGAPLPGILNKLCSTIDIQIGNVVSLVLLPDEPNRDLLSIAHLATECGMCVFSSRSILSSQGGLLGTLQIYSCDERHPNPDEARLITQVVYLAAVALQRDEHVAEFAKNYGDSGCGANCCPREKLPYVN
jgi:hypothetical protein